MRMAIVPSPILLHQAEADLIGVLYMSVVIDAGYDR
jgi:hypothetical protein